MAEDYGADVYAGRVLETPLTVQAAISGSSVGLSCSLEKVAKVMHREDSNFIINPDRKKLSFLFFTTLSIEVNSSPEKKLSPFSGNAPRFYSKGFTLCCYILLFA